MYDFAIIALLALAVLKVADFAADNLEPLARFRTLLTMVLGVGVVVWLDYSVFTGFGVEVRDPDAAIWVTGFMVAGMTVPWRAVFGFLTHDRATGEETLGTRTPIIKRAA
jgi:hypothetical protein